MANHLHHLSLKISHLQTASRLPKEPSLSGAIVGSMGLFRSHTLLLYSADIYQHHWWLHWALALHTPRTSMAVSRTASPSHPSYVKSSCCLNLLWRDDLNLKTLNWHDGDHQSSAPQAYLTPVESIWTNWWHLLSISSVIFSVHCLWIFFPYTNPRSQKSSGHRQHFHLWLLVSNFPLTPLEPPSGPMHLLEERSL